MAFAASQASESFWAFPTFEMRRIGQEIPGMRVIDEMGHSRRKFTGNALKSFDRDPSARETGYSLNMKIHQWSDAERRSFKVVNFGVDSDEALSRRLKEGTNHKRALTDADLDFIKQLRLDFDECKQQPEPYQHPRHRSEEVGNPRCQSRSSLLFGHNARRTIEYAASAMPGSSPGKRKRRQHSENLPHVYNPADDQRSTSTISQEAESSQDLYVCNSISLDMDVQVFG